MSDAMDYPRNPPGLIEYDWRPTMLRAIYDAGFFDAPRPLDPQKSHGGGRPAASGLFVNIVVAPKMAKVYLSNDLYQALGRPARCTIADGALTPCATGGWSVVGRAADRTRWMQCAAARHVLAPLVGRRMVTIDGGRAVIGGQL